MALTRCRLGNLIRLREERNTALQYGVDDVRGVNNLKKLINTKASLDGRDLSKFQIVEPGTFFFNHRTSRNGSKISITYNYERSPIIVTEDYVLFDCVDIDTIDPTWLYMYMSRAEFDRYAIMNSWGSSTEFFNWEDMCDVEIELPPIEVQRKYVAIYEAMCENQRCYEAGLEDLKLACDAPIEQLMKTSKLDTIGNYIEQVDVRNNDMHGQDRVRGISTEKELIATKAKLDGVSLSSYKVINPGELAYVADTSRRGGKISIAQNADDKQYLLSSISIVFKCNDGLIPDYLMLFFTRNEFDRYARFNSWGSARETFDWAEMENVRIPIPTLGVQRSIADLFKAYNERKEINEELKQQIKGLCPILIKGSLEEASKA